jgi:hypothetical protein
VNPELDLGPIFATQAAALSSPFGHTTSVTVTHDDALYMHYDGNVNTITLLAVSPSSHFETLFGRSP